MVVGCGRSGSKFQNEQPDLGCFRILSGRSGSKYNLRISGYKFQKHDVIWVEIGPQIWGEISLRISGAKIAFSLPYLGFTLIYFDFVTIFLETHTPGLPG